MGVTFIGAHEPLHGPSVAMRWGMEPPSAAEDSEAPEGDEEAEIKARSWDAIGAEIDDDLREAILDYWRDAARWGALSKISRKTSAKVMGGVPI